jgi:hypothetical protein
MNRLTTLQEADAIQARSRGRAARVSVSNGNRSPVINPYSQHSFHAYCWQAGYSMDMRNVTELHRDWLAVKV